MPMPLKTKAGALSERAMSTVSEGHREDGSSDDSHSEGPGAGSESNPPTETSDSPKSTSGSKSFSLARAETQMLKYSKAILLFVIAALAVAATFVTYKIILHQEFTIYERTFHAISTEVAEYSVMKTERVFNNLETFGATLTSHAKSTGQAFPFVVFPDFQVRGLLSNEETGAHTITLNPFIVEKDLEAWDKFSSENQGWLAEGHYYDKVVHPELYQVEHYQTDYDHKEELRWNITGVVPYVWIKNKEDRYARDPVGSAPLYSPIWQRAPICDYAPDINQDLRSDPNFTDSVDGMLQVHHPVITPVVDATYLETNFEYRFNPEEMAEPHSYILMPVYDSLTVNRTMVAFLSVFLRWGTYFDDVLPDFEQGIFVVLESTCGQSFTYEIFGRKAVYLGMGDQHDINLDGDGLKDSFEFSRKTSDEEAHKLGLCHYEAHVFPSNQWRHRFFTSQPYLFAAAVFVSFLVTALGFVMYDVLVQRRQEKVMKSAAKTNAIVTSLFPANVRDRLLQDQEDAMKRKEEAKTGAFLNTGKTAGESLDENASAAIFGSKPIADLFPNCTIMFADMVGFTAWSSTRDPTAVFTLLETVYHSFDLIAKRRRVFKVETVGDCYVAVCGLPTPRKDHAVVMGKFASDCLIKMKQMVHKLEPSLGPDTGDLNIRIGLHSGPVTAGVLRGDKGRFQLFGDTMNTASRLESTGESGRIHISHETADILIRGGKGKWVTPREDQVIAKGKGALTTFWFKMNTESRASGSNLSVTSGTSGSVTATPASRASAAMDRALTSGAHGDANQLAATSKLTVRDRRLVAWNVEMLLKILKQVMARRASRRKAPKLTKKEMDQIMQKNGDATVLDEVVDVLALPQFDASTVEKRVEPKSIEISDEVVSQLTDFISRIAGLYRENPFHSFEHASHVTMSVTKLLGRIVNPNDVSGEEDPKDKVEEHLRLHDHTFGITSDPLTQFACVISALIHDADHPGVPNNTLVKEEHPLASKYKNKSVAEQNSVDLAWDILMSEDYKELQSCIFATKDEFLRFRSIIVNVVMATDIMDKDLGAQRKARWEKAFAKKSGSDDSDNYTCVNRKATIVLEHLMQASDVAHTMQHWVVFRKWNERLFMEMYKAFKQGRSEKDPSESWYNGELGFFDYYIIPLAKKLETCGVFGVSSHEYLSYAQANRREWEAKGRLIVKEYLDRYYAEFGDGFQKVPPVPKEGRLQQEAASIQKEEPEIQESAPVRKEESPKLFQVARRRPIEDDTFHDEPDATEISV